MLRKQADRMLTPMGWKAAGAFTGCPERQHQNLSASFRDEVESSGRRELKQGTSGFMWRSQRIKDVERLPKVKEKSPARCESCKAGATRIKTDNNIPAKSPHHHILRTVAEYIKCFP